jgi:uncharacterized membrane protein
MNAIGRNEMIKKDKHELSRKLLNKEFSELTDQQQNVIHHISERSHISKDIRKQSEDNATFGQHVADKVASFGGSWPFIFLFISVMVVWVIVNSFILIYWKKPFDPYPYILLNLILSMLAAIQAPVIIMSQNRQAEKDRLEATHDYEVNLKAELEIMALHDKIDQLRHDQLGELIKKQEDQLKILSRLIRDES